MSHINLNRRRFLGSLGLTAAALACPSALTGALMTPALGAPRRARKPNVIVILSDDVGLDDIGCYGGNFKTPNIDALAAGGVRFEYCYATPLCGPSRSELLSGRYPFRTGMETNKTGNVLKPANETLLPLIMKPAGYVTASVGKWDQLPLEPADWGFDEYFRFQGSGVYRKTANLTANKKFGDRLTYTVNGVTKPMPDNAYVPDMMHDFLADFITRHKDQPFCLYYPMSEMHNKLLTTPDHPGSKGPKEIYADNIAYMDKLVGKLVAHLDQLGLRENTLILFTGDNGTAVGAAKSGTVDDEKINGAKGSLTEGGSRVPLIANWPGTAPKGKLNHDLTDFSDFVPTLAELAGAALPTAKPIDGHSFLPQIKGEAGTPREWVYVELNDNRYVRDAKWKLRGTGELYDMTNAPFKELLVSTTSTDPAAIAARTHLKSVLDNLVGKNPPLATPRKKKKGNKAQNQNQNPRRAARRARRRGMTTPPGN